MASKLRVCVDRVVPDSTSPARAAMNASLRGFHADALRMGGPGLDVFRMSVLTARKWPATQAGQIRCRFLDGSPTQRTKVEALAHQWEDFGNFRFRFVSSGDAEVRISFVADEGSWSAVGTDALVDRYFPKHQPTMNFGWLRDTTKDDEYARVVLHEFGHALGCIHEHESPNFPFKWNKQAVYDYFSGPPNYWSKADIDHNIFDRYGSTETNSTTFDPLSIMLYDFPASFFTDGGGTRSNRRLSDTDKQFIGTIYPKSVASTRRMRGPLATRAAAPKTRELARGRRVRKGGV